MTEYAYVLTITWRPAQHRYVKTLHGVYAASPGETRALITEALLNQARAELIPDDVTNQAAPVAVTYLSLEPNELALAQLAAQHPAQHPAHPSSTPPPPEPVTLTVTRRELDLLEHAVAYTAYRSAGERGSYATAGELEELLALLTTTPRGEGPRP